MRADPYKVLELGQDATASQVRQAYHRLAKRLHPDKARAPKSEDAEGAFRAVQEAFELLSDPTKRASYDQSRRAQDISEYDVEADERGVPMHQSATHAHSISLAWEPIFTLGQ